MSKRLVGALLIPGVLLILGGPAAGSVGNPQNSGADLGRDTGQAVELQTPVDPNAPSADSHVSSVLPEEALSARSDADRLSAMADSIYAFGRSSGFGGQVIDHEDASISVHWKGSVPRSVLQLREFAAEHGVTIHVKSDAELTRDQGLTAAERITLDENLTSAGEITSVSLRANGTGLLVRTAGGLPDGELRDRIVGATGLDPSLVEFAPDEGEIVNLASRVNDARPWKGGIRTRHGSMACSTAFAVLSGSAGRLLSANHCGANKAAKDGAGTTIAPASAVQGKANIDSMSIDPTASPATTGKIYVGGWNSSTTKTVKNWSANWKGDKVCAGGATTGSRCGEVVDDAVTYPGLTGGWYVKARATSGAMAGGADSGGPVYATVSGGVQARGVILGGYTSTATGCGSKNPDVSTSCYRTIAYAPISVVLNSWGYALEVG